LENIKYISEIYRTTGLQRSLKKQNPKSTLSLLL